MKNLKLYLKTLLFCTGLMVAAGCSKFELLKNEDSDGAAAGANLKAQTIKQFLLTDHSTDLTELDLFSAAVKRAGLLDLFGTGDSYTSVFLTNPAMKQLLPTIGYTYVDQVPPIIIKKLLEDLIIK